MSLSVEKLINICASNGLIPIKYFVYKGDLLFLETISISKGLSLMINIPRKYHFDISDLSSDEIYKIKKMRINRDFLYKPHKSPTKVDMQKIYSEIEVMKEFDPNIDTKELEEKLLESYRREISLNSAESEDMGILKDIFRQIERLKLCVQGIEYKICIISKNYLCAIDEDNEISCYYIKHYSKGAYRKLFTSLDLNLIFENVENIESHIEQVLWGVDGILQKSRNLHYDKLLVMTETCKNIGEKIANIESERVQINSCIQNYQNLIQETLNREKIFEEKISNLRSGDNLTNDLTVSRERSKLEKNISSLIDIRNDSMSKLIHLRDKWSDLGLKIDNVLFDNIVLINNILNNLKSLEINK